MIRCAIALPGPNELNGPNVWLSRIIPTLRRQNVDPIVFYLERPDSLESCSYSEALAAKGVRVVKICLTPHIDENIKRITRVALAELVQVIIPNYSVASFYAAAILRNFGVGSLGIIHSDDPFYRDIEAFFITGAERWRVTEIVCVSQYLLGRIRSANTSNIPPSRFIPYGVPNPGLITEKCGEKFTLVYCGRFIEYQKRIYRTMEICQSILDRFSEASALFIGGGPELNAVEAFARKNQTRVEVLRGLSPNETMEAIAKGDAFILLSDFEGMSVAMIEAMAIGLIPIVSDVQSGVRELISNRINGFIVNPDDVEAILRIVGDLISDRDRTKRIAIASRELVIAQGLYIESTVKQWADVIFSAANRSCPSTALPINVSGIIDEALGQLPPPSKTPNGIGWEDRRHLILIASKAKGLNKKIYVWGASSGGRKVYESLAKHGINIESFVDSDLSKHGLKLLGKVIMDPKEITDQRTLGVKVFVIVATLFKEAVSLELEKNGFRETLDYFEAW